MLLLLPLLIAADAPRADPSTLTAAPPLEREAEPTVEPTVRVAEPVSCTAPWTAPSDHGVPLVLVAQMEGDAQDAAGWTAALADGVRAAEGPASVDLAPLSCRVTAWQQAWELAAFSGAAALVWGRRTCAEPDCLLMVQITPGLAPRRWPEGRVPEHWEEPLLLDLFLFDLRPEQRAVVADTVAAWAAWTTGDDAAAQALAAQALGRLEPGAGAIANRDAPGTRAKASLARLQAVAALRATLPEAVFRAVDPGAAAPGGPWQEERETDGAHTIVRLASVDAEALAIDRRHALWLLAEALDQCPNDDPLCRAHGELALERGEARAAGRRPDVARALAEIDGLASAGEPGASAWREYALALAGRPHGGYHLDDPERRLARPDAGPPPSSFFGPPEAVAAWEDRAEDIADQIRRCDPGRESAPDLQCVEDLEDEAFSTPSRHVASFWAVTYAQALDAAGDPERALEQRILALKLAGGRVEEDVAAGIEDAASPRVWALLEETKPFLSRRTRGVLQAKLAVRAAQAGDADRSLGLWSESHRLAADDGEARHYRDVALDAILRSADVKQRGVADRLQLAMLLSETAGDPWLRIEGLEAVAEAYREAEDITRQRAALLAAGSFQRQGSGARMGNRLKRAKLLGEAAKLTRDNPGRWTDQELELAVFAVDEALKLLAGEEPADEDERANHHKWEADLYACKGSLLRTLDRPGEAAEAYDAASGLVQGLDSPTWEADLLAAAAAARMAAEQYDLAGSTYEKAEEMAKASGDLDWASHLRTLAHDPERTSDQARPPRRLARPGKRPRTVNEKER